MFELRLMCPQDRVESLCNALEALDALSICVEDADAQTDAEQALFGEPGLPPSQVGWQRSRIIALYDQEETAREAASLLQVQDFFASCQLLGIDAVADQDWVRLTQSQFAPVEITPAFWVVPTWHEPPPQARHIIRLDPGLAFGTGTHPTTRMCLRWIASYPMPGRVLDYGCGSGILAIGAARYGAQEVLAVDIDQAAVQSTVLNAEANQVKLTADLPGCVQGSFGLVLANILATPLKVLAPLLCSYVQSGGKLVLAGILERQAEELMQAYAPYCQLSVRDAEEGWILMTATL
ncbi:MAG: 50S ribosomal protein L11 methyltransferase [Rhodoferax sp.]|nr:50S ribosomal protein L11 methyltransferase [Rhodoferax sp.]